MKVLVCGGRNYQDRGRVFDVLDFLFEYELPEFVIHGAAAGADSLAGEWAREVGAQEVICPANWKLWGPRAGYMRNAAMLALLPELVVAFPGGKGTANMVKLARQNDIEVKEVE